jgi:hypothetical protein
MSVTRFLISLFLICPLFGYAQFTYLTDRSIEVEDQNGDVLPLPWAGGLNSAQFNRKKPSIGCIAYYNNTLNSR